MFWITLRQHNQEKWEARQAISDMVAPLQLGVGTATTGMFEQNFQEGEIPLTMPKISNAVKVAEHVFEITGRLPLENNSFAINSIK